MLLGILTAILVVPAGAAIATAAAPVAAVHAAPAGAQSAGTTFASSALYERTLAAERSMHIPSTDVFLPNLNAHVTSTGNVIHPLYTAAPAPMGLGDFGIRAKGGVNVGTISYTRSVQAEVTLNSVDPFYLASSSPDIFTLQLNTVLTHVDVLGSHSNQYWIQNVPVYFASTQTLSFEDNIWNFSSPTAAMQVGTLYSTGPGGNLVPGVFYYAIGPTFHMPTPFSVTLWNNATVLSNRPTEFFNYSVTAANGTVYAGSYDEVMFNSSALASPPYPGSPTYQINGKQPNPLGLLNDAEIMLGGPGGGSTTTLNGISATMGLWTQPNGTSAYVRVPGAFDYGTDTGETSEGIAEHSSGGSNPVAVLTPGPSLLYPLWGVVGASVGTKTTTISLSPSNAFIFVSPTSSFNVSKAAWSPSQPGGTDTIVLPAGTYSFAFLLSDYKPVYSSVSGHGSTSLSVSLLRNTHYGLYTPLWAWNNGQLAAISQAGTGSATNPYVLENNAIGPVSPLFGEFNDFFYPVFTAVFLGNTNLSVDIFQAPSFPVDYSLPVEALYASHFGTPQSNNLGYQVYNATHVSLVSSFITGWFFNGISYDANVLFWNTSDSLIAGNTFAVQSAGIIVSGGTNNVIWGNTFQAATTTAANPAQIQYGSLNIALQSYESGDLYYNNWFGTPISAYTPNFNLYTGAFQLASDRWNVSMQPATDVRTVNGWHLTGNILGLGYEGGNFWAAYGNPSNPYHVLPFNDYGLISVGGDHLPLLPYALHRIIFAETGLSGSTTWSVTINGYTQTASAGTAITFWEPSGLYAYAVTPPAGFTAHPGIGAVNLGTTAKHVTIHFT